MRPGSLEWAMNANYAAGGGAGNPTKAPPAAGQIADGYQPDAAVSPQIWNYARWAMMLMLAGCRSERVLNWQAGSVAGIGGLIGGLGHGIYDPIADVHIWHGHTGVAANEEATSDGLIWTGGAPWVVAGNALYCYAAHDGNGTRAQVTGNLVPPGANQIGFSTGFAAWAAWTAGEPNGQFTLIEHDHVGLWVMTDIGGVGGASGDLLVSTGPANAWGAPTSAPGFAAGPTVLAHSHHPAALIYPNDPGNPMWIAMTPAQKSMSADGQTWSAAAAHGIGGTPLGLAYSAHGTRWIATVACGGKGWITYSDDNGSTWNPSAVLGNAACPITSSIVNPTEMQIACDGYGDWMIAIADSAGGSLELHASWDNGKTWARVPLPSTPYNAFADLWYGGGRFMLMTTDGAGNFAAYTSLRADE